MEKKIKISPSIICADLCNLEHDIKEMEQCGIEMVHIDFIDGQFSPSMPLGFAAIERARKITNMKLIFATARSWTNWFHFPCH